jgi:hypothetical protein
MILKTSDIRIQFMDGQTPVQVFESYTASLAGKELSDEAVKFLKSEARDVIQSTWKEIRKKAIFQRLKKELESPKPQKAEDK